MPPLYRIAEVAVYSLLKFLPFLVLALYPFRHSLRFSRRVTGLLILLLTCFQLVLGEQNHQLAMQTMQYGNLQEKIAEARRAKHDVRHHITLMQEYLNEGNYAALRDYLNRYGKSLPNDSPLCYCENPAANAELLYFAQQAKESGIEYTVKTNIPRELPIPDPDISVLLGNLPENALEACKKEHAESRRIIIRADTGGNALCVTVDNTCTTAPRRTTGGELLSTKHRGRGLGTQSVKSIAAQRGGVCRFEAKDGMFYASVYCPLDAAASPSSRSH